MTALCPGSLPPVIWLSDLTEERGVCIMVGGPLKSPVCVLEDSPLPVCEIPEPNAVAIRFLKKGLEGDPKFLLPWRG